MTKLFRILLALCFCLLLGCSPGPNAPASTFVFLDGTRQTSTDLRGKVILVNFWATSCATCVAEMPKLVNTYHTYQARGLDVIAVAMRYDPPNYVVRFTRTRQLPFKVAIDNTGAIAKAWDDVQLTPTTFLLNRRGQIVKRFLGEPDFAALHQTIEKLLQEKTP